MFKIDADVCEGYPVQELQNSRPIYRLRTSDIFYNILAARDNLKIVTRVPPSCYF